MAQNVFYVTVSIFAVFGTIAFLVIIAAFIAIAKRLVVIEAKLSEIARTGQEAATSAKNIVDTGGKLLVWSIYKIFKRFGKSRGKDDNES